MTHGTYIQLEDGINVNMTSFHKTNFRGVQKLLGQVREKKAKAIRVQLDPGAVQLGELRSITVSSGTHINSGTIFAVH